MSKQWWAVKHGKSILYVDSIMAVVERVRDEYAEKLLGTEIVPVRIVEDGEPCEWEMSPAMMSSPKWITNCDMLKMQGFHYCPNCGRKLEER